MQKSNGWCLAKPLLTCHASSMIWTPKLVVSVCESQLDSARQSATGSALQTAISARLLRLLTVIRRSRFITTIYHRRLVSAVRCLRDSATLSGAGKSPIHHAARRKTLAIILKLKKPQYNYRRNVTRLTEFGEFN